MRKAEIKRKTTETDIMLSLRIDGKGGCSIDTGCGFFDHMLELFARHGSFDLSVKCDGDIAVDCHHTVEDVGILLGRALSDALGERRGIVRYGSFLLPMDEALMMVALDISGRAGFYGELGIPSQRIGSFDTELVEEFFTSFCRAAGVTLHIRKIAGTNSHHIVEAMFKGVARALKEAASIDSAAPDAIPSTKGTIL